MKKLKLLWFGLVPLGWWLSLKLIIWVNNTNLVDWSSKNDTGLQMFLVLTGILGIIFLVLGSIFLAIFLAIDLQD